MSLTFEAETFTSSTGKTILLNYRLTINSGQNDTRADKFAVKNTSWWCNFDASICHIFAAEMISVDVFTCPALIITPTYEY